MFRNFNRDMLYNNFLNKNLPVPGKPKWVPKSTVVPVGVKQTKGNDKNNSAVNCVRAQIYAAFIFGINRRYLLQSKILFLFFGYAYTLTVASLVLFNMYNSETISVAHFVFQYTLCVEYLIIVTLSLISRKGNLIRFFRNLDKFDEKLNLSKDLKTIDPGYPCIAWLIGCVLYSLIEYIMLYIFLFVFLDDTVYSIYVMMLTHDFEQILFFMLLRNIYLRLLIIKAHVCRMYNAEDRTSNYRETLSKVEALSNNIRLDITSLHQVYDLLHNCAEQLNSAMSLPVSSFKYFKVLFTL